MAVSGLLVAEANLYVRQQVDRAEVGLSATAEYLLGKSGAIAFSLLYLFIHYALLVAYTARGGDILAITLSQISFLPIQIIPLQVIPLWCGHLFFTLLLGALLIFGKEDWISRVSTALLLATLVSFIAIMVLAAGRIESFSLFGLVPETVSWQALGSVVPVMFVAFVYHNVVPVVVTRLAQDVAQIRKSVLIGSFIPLFLFLVWNSVILLSPGLGGSGEDPIVQLQVGAEGSHLATAISAFSELAVMTSFIGFVYGLLGFFEDIFAQTFSSHYARIVKFALVFLPPLFFSVVSPTIFFDAIEIAGAFGVSILFGILPALMVWRTRSASEEAIAQRLVPGGKATLIGVAGFAIAVIAVCGCIRISPVA